MNYVEIIRDSKKEGIRKWTENGLKKGRGEGEINNKKHL